MTSEFEVESRVHRLPSGPGGGKVLRRRRSTRWWRQTAVQSALAIFGLAIAAPMLYLLSTAFKSQSQWLTDPLLLTPSPLTTENLGKFLSVVDYGRLMFNTLFITVTSTIGTVISCSVVAYPLARLRFRGRGAVTLLVLLTMLLPAQILLIPQYIVFVKLHWIDTFWPLIVPNFFAVNGFILFFLRQSFRTIPRELEEAVLIDGGSRFTAFYRVILPLSVPSLVIAAVLQGVASYNDYFSPIIYLHSPDKITMAMAIPLASTTVPGISAQPVVSMGTVLFVIPVAIVFIMAQRWLTRGVSLAGSVKA